MPKYKTKIRVNMREIRKEFENQLSKSKAFRREVRDFVDDVYDTWHKTWDRQREGKLAKQLGIPHPYQTGNYKAHIKKKRVTLATRLGFGKLYRSGLPIGQVYNDSRVAHWIEYGTGPDKPGSRSPWGPNTPTPEFATMRKTWAKMHGKRFRVRRSR
ncbi:hypothetical protein [Mycolicibacterium phlei]|uniref:hypothetical protein n=1 Tax=Mycolicibacterium phlei TaxID=1771 RepID=UPI0002E93117|nr:hypothetical protein [Mycolicibacterium phlei]MBF4194669.1 hypothetical protein [Mycolicibacterium phlei]